MESKPVTDEMVVRRVNAAVKIALEKHKAMDLPSIVYDRKTQQIYALSSDGKRVPVADRVWKGRYSERKKEKT